MKKLLATLTALFCITAVASFLWLTHGLQEPGPNNQTAVFMVKPGSTGLNVAADLAQEKLITQPKIFYFLLRWQRTILKAGEYEIPARASMLQIVDILQNGEAVQHLFTLPEGLTVKQTLQLLQDTEFLSSTIDKTPAEGSLLPESYSFIRNDTRQSIITRMQKAQADLLTELWVKRDKDVPLTDPQQAITLASIVEKETGKPEERARVAGLFYNRLKINMPLQTDPTVVYAVTDGLGSMQGKRLYSKYLQIDSPYNTYLHAGLPPGPIANPGKASLEAVLHPEKHKFLYFVADGTGGHVFAATLNEHNKNVAEWRKFRRKNRL